jgi:DNA helicase II / ATP-dependent DNA helicase PcrA
MSQPTDFLEKLNAAQRKAVEQLQGPVLVLAGPGTGKTHLLTARIGHILQSTDAKAENILCLTFTNAAAIEMRERLQKKIGAEAYKVMICTFHGFSEWVMAEYPLKFETQKAGRELADDLMKALAYRDAVKTKHWKYFRPIHDELSQQKDVTAAISNLKRENCSPEKLRELIPSEREKWAADENNFYKKKYKDFNEGDEKPAEREKLENRIARMQEFSELWEVYEEKLKKRGGYDFDDLILWVTDSLAEDENLCFDLQERFQWMLVDEYQDTNSAQNSIIWALTDYEQPNVFAVGDDDQSIYRFQGASTENIREFRSRFEKEGLVEIALEENYRSGQTILDAAFTSIKNNTDRADEDRALIASGENKSDSTIERVIVGSVPAEQTHIVDQIRRQMEDGVEPNEIAILVRKNREIDELSRILPQFGIPVAASIRGNIFDDEFVGQLISLLKIFITPETDDTLWEVLHAPYWDIPAQELLGYSLSRERHQRVIEQLLKADNLGEKTQQFLTWLANSRKDFWHCRPEVVTERLLYSSGLLDYLVEQKRSDSIASLRKLVSWITDQRCDTMPEILERLDLVKQFNIRVRPDALPADRRSVYLLTAHGAKGREFDVVFVPGLIDKSWGNPRGKNSSVPLPHIFTDREFDVNAEERRLFFVALTRARKKIFLSHSTKDGNGRDKMPSPFWHEIPDSLCTDIEPDKIEERAQELLPTLLLSGKELLLTNEEETILRDQVKKFVWSATALQNYIDCPRRFLFQQLFRFPRKPTPEPQLALGVALHEALEKTLRGTISEPALLSSFERALRGQNLKIEEFNRLLEHGTEILKRNFKEKSDTWMAENVQTEINFGKYNPEIDGIRVTGKVDKIVFTDDQKKSVRIVDYKSGKPKYITKGEREWRQLVFYDLLARAAKAPWSVESCVLEFLTPDSKNKLDSKTLQVTDEDRTHVISELKDAHQKILNLEFPLVENPKNDSEIEFWQHFGK